ncbi:tripartite tricarboxylate transporter TctB family protein [Phaeovulum sp. W22_SRMD_FR3]|uniref:tripartite tricarboxylate transporter TctB family protein n=1 Tax=Phaeovulum sp. W22_SRMD_FR3 TaxID=3240274 RepID=UPI003F950173
MPVPRLRALAPLVVASAIALFAIGWSFTFKEVPPFLIRGFQPAAFPRFVAGLILILALLACLELARQADRPAAQTEAPLVPAFWRTLLMLAIFAAVLALGDFLVAMMIGTAGIAAMWGERRPVVLALLGVVAPVLVILLFDQLFQVRFPRGFLLTFYYG